MAPRRYDVLCNELAARQRDRLRLFHTAEQIARTYRDAFAVFLGIDNDPLEELVSLERLDFEGDEPAVVDGGPRVALPNQDYDWIFVIRVQIQDPRFTCRCSIRMRDNATELRIADRSEYFPIKPNDSASYEPACEALYTHMLTWLRWRPTSGGPEPQIGFDLSCR